MCGIIGGNLFASKKTIEEAQNLIMHRGHDAHDAIYINGFWMGHNRLSIQDLNESANQPMWDSDKQICIVFNGELWKKTMDIFNNELRQEFSFNTKNSDTEVFLYAYKKYGTDVFKHLDGMFSATIYDTTKNKVIMVRDWVGRLPFYYLHKYDALAFSSEMKALTETFTDASSEVKIVLPGHFYEYDRSNGQITKNKYYDIEENIPTSDTNLCVVSHKIRDLLDRAVENELIADVPVCTILSGGIDSVLITYLLKKRVKDLKAYVVNLGSSTGKDDLHYARLAAKWLDIPLTEVKINKTNVQKEFRNSIWAAEMDSWTQITPAVAQLFLAKKIHEDGYKVVFGGEGADELFGSYGNIQKMYYKQDTNKSARINLIKNLHKNNLIRTNKAMMFGGTVELRTPFLDREFAEYALSVITIDAKHHKHTNGFVDINWVNGSHMKYPLRKSFAYLINDEGMPEELLFRKKETFQVGCHTDYLRDEQEKMTTTFNKLFRLPQKKKGKSKIVKSNILLKDKADLQNIESHFDEPIHVLGAMSKPNFPLEDIEIISVKFSKVGKSTIDKYPNLKAVIVRGHGHDIVNKKLLDEKGISVYKLNQYTESCAEWCVQKVIGNKVMVVGINGNIGSVVASKLIDMGKEITDSYEIADTVISCVPYDKYAYKKNEKFFNKNFFNQFTNVIDFISISRGPTHDNVALYELLSEGKIRSTHLDTVSTEIRDKLLSIDSFHYYEHTSWQTKQMPNDEFGKLLFNAVQVAKENINDKLQHSGGGL